MKKWLFLVVIIGMLGWSIFDFNHSKRHSTQPFEKVNEVTVDKSVQETKVPIIGLDVGNKAPEFELKTLTGDHINLSDFRGHRVMLNFWAT